MTFRDRDSRSRLEVQVRDRDETFKNVSRDPRPVSRTPSLQNTLQSVLKNKLRFDAGGLEEF